MQAGRLRDIIEIQKRPTTRDASGQRSGAWVPVLSGVYAEVIDLAGQELINAQVLAAEVNVQINMRGFPLWRASVRPDCRVVFDGRVFDIKGAINPDGRNRELQLFCVEIVA